MPNGRSWPPVWPQQAWPPGAAEFAGIGQMYEPSPWPPGKLPPTGIQNAKPDFWSSLGQKSAENAVALLTDKMLDVILQKLFPKKEKIYTPMPVLQDIGFKWRP